MTLPFISELHENGITLYSRNRFVYERSWIGNNLSFNDLQFNDWIYDIYAQIDYREYDEPSNVE